MGSLWPLSGTVERDNSDNRASGAKAYFYDATTLNARTTYSDGDLGTPHLHPVVADTYGRWPSIFLGFGDYRVRVYTSTGTQLYDIDEIPNAEPPTQDQIVDPNALLTTGDVILSFKDGVRSGFVRCNGRSIGSESSGASERANADCEDLFEFLWNSISNTICAVGGGRGASAALDWAANKVISLPDQRGRYFAGLDTMGNSAASRFPASVAFLAGSATAGASVVGLNEQAIDATQLPAHTHTFSATSGAGTAHSHGVSGNTGAEAAHTHTGTTGNQSASHTHDYATPAVKTGTATGFATLTGSIWCGTPDGSAATGNQSASHNHTFTSDAGSSHLHAISLTSATESAHTHAVSGTTGSTGPGAALGNMPEASIGSFLMRL